MAKAARAPLPPSVAALVPVDAVAGTLALLFGLALLAESRFDAGAAVAGAACAAVGIAGLLAGRLLRRRRPAGRRLQIGLAVLGLPLLPFWTAACVWILVAMSRRGERTLLSGRGEEEWTPAEADAVRALPAPSRWREALLAAGLLALLALEVALFVGLPDFGAIERAKQKRTMADLRSARTAIESFAAREGRYPDTSSMDDLARLLEPGFIGRLPRVDAWGHPIRYESWRANETSPAPDSYLLASPGRDGAYELGELRTVAPGPTRSPSADILLRDGAFVLYPNGAIRPGER